MMTNKKMLKWLDDMGACCDSKAYVRESLEQRGWTPKQTWELCNNEMWLIHGGYMKNPRMAIIYIRNVVALRVPQLTERSSDFEKQRHNLLDSLLYKPNNLWVVWNAEEALECAQDCAVYPLVEKRLQLSELQRMW